MLNRATALTPELIRLRRDIHRYPELSFQEKRTARLVAETLQEIGGMTLRTGVGKTGVVADLGPGNGPTIAIRADMDALPILEKTGAEYASLHQGVMHACGHDAHVAILLGVAHLLKERLSRGDLRGRVRFLFQPAEENVDEAGLSGAPRMIEDGALVGVDAVIALHVDAAQPFGLNTINSGWASAAVDSFEAWITASGGHGAYPHESTDPLWMLGPVLTTLHGIVARRVNPMKPAVVSLGEIHGGTANNIIPEEVYLHGTLRSFDVEVREQLVAEVEQALSVVRPLGGDFRLQIRRGYPAGWNDPRVTGWLKTASADLLGPDSIKDDSLGMGAEDFAYMCQVVPGAMMMVGAAPPDGLPRYHHTSTFDIDERVLATGAAILAETAVRFLGGRFELS